MTDGVTRFVDHEPTSIVRISLKDKVLQLSRTTQGLSRLTEMCVCVCLYCFIRVRVVEA